MPRIAALVLVLFAGPAAAGAPWPWEGWRSPARFAEVDVHHLVVAHSSACLDGCRYDRSNRGPEPAAANPHPLRWLYRDGDEVVLFDERGAGAMTRLWMTTGDGVSRCFDPAVRARLRVDGELRLDVPLARLFDGSLVPFTPPLVADRLASSGGYVSRVPIAYAQSLRFGLAGAEAGNLSCDPSGWGLLWYQAQFVRLPAAAAVDAFPAFDEAGLRAFLETPPGEDPWHGLLAPEPFAFAGVNGPATLPLATRNGGGWLRGLRLDVPASAWPHLRLRVRVDGATTIDLAFADFFAADAAGSARGLLSGIGADGVAHAWWPMPYARAVTVELVVDAGLAAPIDVAGSAMFDALTPAGTAHLHATASEACGPGDRLVLADDGAGKLVALSARYTGDATNGLDVLEGDERIVVDGATAPAWYGTGVEDFFDAGFYFDHGPFNGALAGAPRVAATPTGTTAAWRVFLGDAPTWTSRLRIHQEAGALPAAATAACTRHVVFRYRHAQARVADIDGFEVGDSAAVAAHAYELPDDALCAPLSSSFADEPPTARTAVVCRYASGSSRFRFAVGPAVEGPLRLRRSFDAGAGIPGETAGAPAAEVRRDGVVVGRFPPAAANPLRRWQQQEILLDLAVVAGPLDLEVVPLAMPSAAAFSESAWTLRAVLSDHLHADGFDREAARDEP